MRYVDNEANTQWSRLLGSGASGTINVGYSVIEVQLWNIQKKVPIFDPLN